MWKYPLLLGAVLLAGGVALYEGGRSPDTIQSEPMLAAPGSPRLEMGDPGGLRQEALSSATPAVSRAPTAPTVLIEVYAEESGRFLQAEVRHYPPGRSDLASLAEERSEGTYELPSGESEWVFVSAKGYLPDILRIPRQWQGVRRVYLRAGRTLRGQVIKPDGAPGPGGMIVFASRSGRPASAREFLALGLAHSVGLCSATDEDGRFELVGLPLGGVGVVAGGQGLCSSRPRAVGPEGDWDNVQVRVGYLLRAAYVIRDTSGNPVSPLGNEMRKVTRPEGTSLLNPNSIAASVGLHDLEGLLDLPDGCHEFWLVGDEQQVAGPLTYEDARLGYEPLRALMSAYPVGWQQQVAELVLVPTYAGLGSLTVTVEGILPEAELRGRLLLESKDGRIAMPVGFSCNGTGSKVELEGLPVGVYQARLVLANGLFAFPKWSDVGADLTVLEGSSAALHFDLSAAGGLWLTLSETSGEYYYEDLHLLIGRSLASPGRGDPSGTVLKDAFTWEQASGPFRIYPLWPGEYYATPVIPAPSRKQRGFIALGVSPGSWNRVDMEIVR
jgi:hypothetical protein